MEGGGEREMGKQSVSGKPIACVRGEKERDSKKKTYVA